MKYYEVREKIIESIEEEYGSLALYYSIKRCICVTKSK